MINIATRKMGAKQLKGRRLTVVTGTGTWV